MREALVSDGISASLRVSQEIGTNEADTDKWMEVGPEVLGFIND